MISSGSSAKPFRDSLGGSPYFEADNPDVPIAALYNSHGVTVRLDLIANARRNDTEGAPSCLQK